ncbi:MAG: carbohydrate ABC transporter permease [Bacilli bacterium]
MKKIMTYIILLFAAFIFLFPFVWTLISITNESNDILQGKLTLGSHMTDNFYNLFVGTNFIRCILNTFFITIVLVVVSVFISSLTAYGFEFLAPSKYEKLYNLMILTLMVPFAALMIPLFKLVAHMGLMDSYMGIMITGFFSVFLLFFFRQSMKKFPFELIEAARIDGLKEFWIFIKIFMPSMKSSYITAIIVSFMGSWNSYLWPLVVTQDPNKRTVQLFLSNVNSAQVIDYGVLVLGVVISTIPTIILFAVLQKYFVAGMIGSGK